MLHRAYADAHHRQALVGIRDDDLGHFLIPDTAKPIAGAFFVEVEIKGLRLEQGFQQVAAGKTHGQQRGDQDQKYQAFHGQGSSLIWILSL